MKYVSQLTGRDRELAGRLAGFVPAEVYDIHSHLFSPGHFAPGAWPILDGTGAQGCAEHRSALQRYIPSTQIHGLYFGLPHASADRPAVNAWIADQAQHHGTPLSRALLLVSPQDDPATVRAALSSGRFCGIKVYHCYASRPDTFNAGVEEYAPEWIWELLQEVRGVLMVHLVRDAAIEDPDNQRALRRLVRAYPRVQLILAHIACSFNYRNARAGLGALADLENVVVDTSVICEAETFRTALKILGPRRVLWGSDFAVSEACGRCVTTGDFFFWLCPEALQPDVRTVAATRMTLVGIESLLCLREACEDAGLGQRAVEDIFYGNACRVLAAHLPAPAKTLPAADGGRRAEKSGV